MSINPRHDFKPCAAPGAFSGGLRRAEFFDGMVLSEADLKREQSYWQMKRRLTNRALGQGVVWGLNVDWDSKARRFTICPGYGLSCCGDDLVVECPAHVTESELVDPCSEDFKRLFADPADPCACDPAPDGPVEACLLLEYVECPEDPRQVFEDPCAQSPDGCRYGAVRETVRLRLVPPPPPPHAGPIERFCDSMAELRAAIEAETGQALPQMAFEQVAPQLELRLDGLREDATVGKAIAPLATEEGASATAKIEGGETAELYRVRLTPAPGYVFASVTADNDPPRTIETMLGFETEQVPGGFDTYANRLTLEMVPIFGGGSRYSATVVLDGASGEDGVALTARVELSSMAPNRTDCLSILQNGLALTTDPRCIARTLGLAMMCAWFKGQIGTPACGDGEEAPDEVKVALAWAICWAAWNHFWGIDAGGKTGAAAERCLARLMEEWCAGFHYKGPRCDTDAHGIHLGCVRISRKGRIECFDPWAHRRHVLTGPLVSHWGGLFGLAPLDQIAGRFASWICCVGATPMPEVDAGLDVDLAWVIEMAGSAFAFGETERVREKLAAEHMVSAREVDDAAFMAAAMRALTSTGRATMSSAARVELVSAPGGRMHVVVPAAELQPAGSLPPPELKEVDSVLVAELARTPPMVRTVARGLVAELADTLPLARLKVLSGAEELGSAVEVLEANGVETIGALLSRGADDVTRIVGPALVASGTFDDEVGADKALAQIFAASERTLRAAGAAIADEGEARDEDDPMTRVDLSVPGLITRIRKDAGAHLKPRSLSDATVRRIAERMIARQ